MIAAEIVAKLKKFENLHILLWLIKDSCWMLEIKWLGTIMIVPTLSVAVWIVYMTRQSHDVFINLAVLFWIIANSSWMLMEFFNYDSHKIWLGIPFFLGLASVSLYYLKQGLKKNQ
jgi:hypothetical protein